MLRDNLLVSPLDVSTGEVKRCLQGFKIIPLVAVQTSL